VTDRHPGGRPVTTARGAAAGRQFLVRLSANEAEAIERAAELAGQSAASWLRDAGLRAAKRRRSVASE